MGNGFFQRYVFSHSRPGKCVCILHYFMPLLFYDNLEDSNNVDAVFIIFFCVCDVIFLISSSPFWG